MLINEQNLSPFHHQFILIGGDDTDFVDVDDYNNDFYAIKNQSMNILTAADHNIGFNVNVKVFDNAPDDTLINITEEWDKIYFGVWDFNNKLRVSWLFDDNPDFINIKYNRASIEIYKNKRGDLFNIYIYDNKIENLDKLFPETIRATISNHSLIRPLQEAMFLLMNEDWEKIKKTNIL